MRINVKLMSTTFCVAVYYALQSASKFLSLSIYRWENYWEVGLAFEAKDEILKCDHLNKSFWPVVGKCNKLTSFWISQGFVVPLRSQAVIIIALPEQKHDTMLQS